MANFNSYSPESQGVIVFPFYSFSVPEISTEDREELEKRVLNYLSEGTDAQLTSEERASLVAHINFLRNSYFSTGETAVETPEMNDVTFSFDKWNIFSKNIKALQAYAKEPLFSEVNGFINNFNNSVLLTEQTINNYLNKSLNNVYKTNTFEDGSNILQPLTIEDFEQNYQRKYSIYEENIQNQVNRVVLSKEKPQEKNIIWLKVKE